VLAKQRRISPKKVRIVNEYAELLNKYNGALIVSITGVSAPVLHQVRAKLREEGDVLKVIKNTLLAKAIDRVAKRRRDLEKLKSYLIGQNAIIFTNKNPYLLKIFLDKNKVKREARAGDIAQSDIVIREGNTNLPPGPIISLFNKLKVPITIKEGSIWVSKDTVVAREGEEISSDLAELLKRLGMKPIEVSLKVKVAYSDGIVIEGKELELDLNEYENTLKECVQQALNLSLNAAYPTIETIELLITKAHLESITLSLNAVYITEENLPILIAKAQSEARILHDFVFKESS